MSSGIEHHYILWSRQNDDTLNTNRGSFALSRSIIMMGLATTCVALRFVCRKIRTAKYALDDWMLLAALVSPPVPNPSVGMVMTCLKQTLTEGNK